MEKKEYLCNAIKKIAWGYVLLYFNINLGTIDILPSWLGYILFVMAIRYIILDANTSVKRLSIIGGIIALHSGIAWILAIFYSSINIIPINIIFDILSIYFHYQLLTNLANVAKKYECSQEKNLLNLRIIQTVILSILTFTVFFEELYVLSLILIISQIIVMICICVELRNLKHCIESIPDDVFVEK